MTSQITRSDFPDHQHEPFRPATTKIRCPQCRSRDILLTEVGELETTWTVKQGRLNRSAGHHEPGRILAVHGRCSECDHAWVLRKVKQIIDCVTEIDV